MRAKLTTASGWFTLVVLTAGGVRAGDAAAPPAAARTVEQPGMVEAAEQVSLYSAISGYVASGSADIGDRVKKGDVLAVLAAPGLKTELKQKTALLDVAKAQVEQSKRAVEAAEAAREAFKAHLEGAQATVKRAQAEYEYRKAQLKRFEQLEQNKAIDSQIVDEKRDQVAAAEAAVEAAETAVKAAEADLTGASAKVAAAQADVQVAEARVEAAVADVEHAQGMLDFTRLQAPFDGVVLRRSVYPGDYVRPPSGDRPTALFVVARVDSVRVVVAVPEADAVRLKVGAPAVVRLDALKGQEFKGKVTRTAGALDPKTRTLRAEIDLPNPDGKLMPGMYGTVVITPDEGTQGATDKPKGRSSLIPALPPGASAPIMLPFDPTAADLGRAVRGTDVRTAVGEAPLQIQGAGPPTKIIVIVEVDRQKAADAGLSAQEVIHQAAAAMHSDFWIDPVTHNQYFVGVQYPPSDRR